MAQYVDIIEYTKIGMTDGVKEMIAMKADVNEKDRKGDYAVLWATKRNDLDILKLLVDAGAFLEVRGGNGITPLMYSRANCNLKMEQFILDNINLFITKEPEND